MALMDKKKDQGRRAARRRVHKKRRRTGLLVFLALVVLTAGAVIFFGSDQTSQTVDQTVGRVSDPTVEEAPEIIDEPATEEESGDEEEATDDEDEDEPSVTPPDDPTMFLSVPKLGINGAIVADGDAGLELGAMHLPGTGFPWQPESNTYIAGHRVGFPGTGSDRIFYSLPALSQGDEVTLTDSLGREYTYAVSTIFAVTPFDTWVADPVGDDVVSLQVCTESPDDWWTIGPSLMSSGPESGRLIVRAERVT
jgi:sortase A